MQYPFDSRNSFESYVKGELRQFQAEIRVVCGIYDLEVCVASSFSTYVEGMLHLFSTGQKKDAFLAYGELETNQRIMKGALAWKFDARLLTKFDRIVQNLSFGVGTLY